MKEAEKKPIPLVVVEEHHEAFFVWHYAVRNGWVAAEGNTLLHFDAHSDMALPRLRRPLSSIGDLADLADFTYRELNIGDFIWPAVYQGLFKRVLWIRYRQRLSEGGWRTLLIGAKNPDETEFFTASSLDSSPYKASQVVRSVDYSPMTTQECFKADKPAVLDIDLDYFCCNEHPRLPVQEVETTRSVYEEFHHNPYHFLHFAGKISVKARDGGFFIVFDDLPYRHEPDSPNYPTNQGEIQTRITDAVHFLSSHSVIPPLIVVCRSVQTGYTPREHSAFVEKGVIEHLSQLYHLEVFSINDLLARLPPARTRPVAVPAF